MKQKIEAEYFFKMADVIEVKIGLIESCSEG